MNQFLKEIYEQPQAVRDASLWLLSPRGERALDAVYDLWKSGRKNILFTGMGSSYFVGMSAATICNAQGLKAVAINAAELLHYQMQYMDKTTLLVCISQSGESFEVVSLLERLNPQFPVVAICNNVSSSLARRAVENGVLLKCCSGEETMTSTKTFINCHQLLCALTGRLCGVDHVPASVWESVAQAVQTVLDSKDSWMESCRRVMGIPSFVQLIGRGPMMDAVCQSALMFMEASHTPASYLTGGDFRHGPLETVDENFVAVVLTHSASFTYAQSTRLVDDILSFGGRVVLVSDTEHHEKNDRLCNIIVPLVEGPLCPMVHVIPLQLIVDDLARRKGFTAGDFAHGNKVTAIE